MEPLKTYSGTLHNGRLVTDTPLSDGEPLRVLVTVVEPSATEEKHDLFTSQVQIRPATKPFDLNSPESKRLRELLSGIPGGLVEDILEERRSER